MSAIMSNLNSDKESIMPKYLLQYRVQTCLTSKTNVELSFDGHKATFLFSQKHPSDTTVLAQMKLGQC